MDLNELRKLVRLMEKAELAELEIDDSKAGLRVHLRRGSAYEAGEGLAPVVQVVPAPGTPLPVAASVPADSQLPAAGGGVPGTVPFLSPMVGTFYRAPSPEAESYIEVGTRISEDTVVCIVEAMKVMNEIKSETRGEVVEILVENGEPVEFGQPLFLVKPV